MDVVALLVALRRWLPADDQTPKRLAGALAAAGVLAARDADPARPGPLLPPPQPGAASYGTLPAVRWSDPTSWVERAGEQASVLDDWWSAELVLGGPHLAAGVRLVIDAETVGAEAPVAALGVLRDAAYVRAVVAEGRFPRPPRGVPMWTWPLRLSVAGNWPVQPLRERGNAPSWWAELAVPVAASGPWAVASLALLGEDAVEGAASSGVADGPVRSTAVVVLSDPTAPPPIERLAAVAARHAAAVVAVADAGPDRNGWIIEVLTALSHDRPLDVALLEVADLFDRPAPFLLGDPAVLDRTRVRAVLARAAARVAARPTDPDRPDAERRLRGGVMRHLIDGGLFESENAEASDAARILRAEHAQRRAIPDRFLLAELRVGHAAVATVAPHARYDLAVWIGADVERAASDAPPFPEELLAAEDRDEVELAVVVTDLALRPGESRPALQAMLRLPRDGDAEPASFPIRTGGSGSSLEFRVVVLYQHRFVLTGLLRAQVGTGTRPTFTVESVVRADTSELELCRRHDVSLVVNHNSRDVPVVLVCSDERAEVSAPDQLRGVQEHLSTLLNRLVNEPETFSGYASAAYSTLLVDLARSGRQLNNALFGRLGEAADWTGRLRDAGRISVLSAHPGAVLPLELVYDRHLADGFGAVPNTLCPSAAEYLGASDCPGNCGEPTPGQWVCPFGFWGTRKVIERHVNGARVAALSKDFALAPSPDVERHRIGLGEIIAAASARADHNDAQAWTTAAATLAGEVTLAGNWLELADRVTECRDRGSPPDVLLLVTHVTQGPNGMVLEIGDGDEWPVLRSLDPLVLRSGASQPDGSALAGNPLVMVLGCGSAAGRAPMFEVPARFLEEGAPAVVAALTTVLGRDIVPVAVRMLEELRRLGASGGTGALLGEAMLAARRRCMLQGQGAVLALVAFGDTDWQLGLDPADS